jgi:acyl-coenzyme A synthetase/AMP-(fatty) acid ligase
MSHPPTPSPAPGLFEEVRAATARRPDVVAFAAGRRAWTVRDLLAAAERLAGHLTRQRRANEPIIAETTGVVATALVTLAGDLAAIPVVHRDPTAAATGDVPDAYAGQVVRDRRAGDLPPGAGMWSSGHGPRLWCHSQERGRLLDRAPARSQIFLTSGSTGVPAAVVRLPSAIIADARRVGGVLKYGEDAVVVAAPVFHAYGFNYGLMAPLLYGVTARPCPVRSVPSQLARAARAGGATAMIALPFHYRLLAGSASAATRSGLAGIRNAVSAGAPLSPGVAAAVARRHAFALHNCYGSSEAGAVTLTRVTGAEPAHDAGPPLPGVSARSDADGELLLRTDSLAAGYLTPDGMTALPRAGDWFRTGDLAELPEDGRIRLLGRVDAIINVAGEKVNPAEVERVLAGHPAVAEVLVVAGRDRVRGQIPLARIVLETAGAAQEIQAIQETRVRLVRWARERLSPHQVPREIEFVPELPKTATGKPAGGSP